MTSLIKIAISIFLIYGTCAYPQSDFFAQEEKVVYASDLNLVLIGFILSKKKNNVVLVKNSETSKLQAAKVGYVIFKKYILRKIQENMIIVQEKESGEKIRIVKNGFGFGPPKKKKKKTQNYEVYKEEGFERNKTQIGITQTFKENFLKNELASALMKASAVPVVVSGQIIGFEFSLIESGSIYEKIGLKDGDVVKSINNIELDSVAKSLRILNSLRQKSQISVEYVRDGEIIPMNIQIK